MAVLHQLTKAVMPDKEQVVDWTEAETSSFSSAPIVVRQTLAQLSSSS
ncbi:unnamed protein product [Soboliphyme baturini]|uniref:ATG7_N domain-containing protein n=1 Tax=Soboliphyme baturini TaxID=241478 RepID=A0A183IHJ3_9BILA|nr:unnamed protein product [Soboliphyme baturini]